MIPYKYYRYIFPPRAEKALPASSLKDYDNGTFIAQPKLNGDCMLIFTNGIETVVMNRHKEAFSKSISLIPTLRTLHRETAIEKEGDQKNKWMILVGEYMSKSKKNAEGARAGRAWPAPRRARRRRCARRAARRRRRCRAPTARGTA